MLFILICGSSWRTSSVSSQRVTYAEYCPCIVPSTSICPMPSAFGAGAYGSVAHTPSPFHQRILTFFIRMSRADYCTALSVHCNTKAFERKEAAEPQRAPPLYSKPLRNAQLFENVKLAGSFAARDTGCQISSAR